MDSDRVSQHAFLAVSALLFAASAALTATGGMRMPGQTWPAAAASFLGMWVVMKLLTYDADDWAYDSGIRTGGPR